MLISVCFIRTQDDIERQGSVLVDYADLMGNVLVNDTLHELATELKEQPEVVLNCLGLAIHQVHTLTDRLTDRQTDASTAILLNTYQVQIGLLEI